MNSGDSAPPSAVELERRRARTPAQVARTLAGAYGRRLDPVIYTQGVGVSGRLRLHELANAGGEAVELVEPYVSGARPPFKDAAGGQDLAGVVWAEELHRLTGDGRYLELIVQAADRFRSGGKDRADVDLPPPPADPDFRTEDMFFTSAVLGRAFAMTGRTGYVDLLAPYLLASAAHQRPDGLFWHCDGSPYYWGRGNAFAALGFAEALSYLPADHPARPALLASHVRHLDAIAATQAPSGMLRQVLDVATSYEELSATCMTGYAIARGIRRGWLDRSRFRPVLDRLWAAASERIDDRAGLVAVCAGTGPQPDLRAYLDRPAVSGHDDRGGSLALWFATEMAACILTPVRA